MQLILLGLMLLLAGCSWMSGQSDAARHTAPPPPASVVDSGVAPSPSRVASYVDIQRKLTEANDYRGPIDGVYGPATEAAMRTYQRTHDLPVTGRAEADTLAKMGL